MIKRYHKILFLLLIITVGCEKDDICIEGSDTTSRITIGFIDYENKGPKSISLESIRGIGLDSVIEGIVGNNLKLPLIASSNKTEYVLEYNEILDTVTIHHQSIHKYLNRSCLSYTSDAADE